MKKYIETISVYKSIRNKLVNVLGKLNQNVTKSLTKSEFVYVPCETRYLLYITQLNKYTYWYFYAIDIPNRDKDFCIEVDNSKYVECVFLCTVFDNTRIFVSDILVNKSKFLEVNYLLRYNLLLETIPESVQIDIHYKMSVSINLPEDTDFTVFARNFKYNIQNFEKININSVSDNELLYFKPVDFGSRVCVIKKTQKSEVFNVHSKETDELFGLLYIKTLLDSKYVNGLFTETSSVEHVCKFNKQFNKWQIMR